MIIELPSIENLDTSGKKVLLRVDFNVPIDNNVILDTGRIDKTMPTIEHLLRNGAAIIIISHLGRPKNSDAKDCCMRVVAEKLAELLPNNKVTFLPFSSKEGPAAKDCDVKAGEVLLLENIRYYPQETSTDPEVRKEFAKKLAFLGDIYINDAFGACHREHASVKEIAQLLPSYAGLLLKKEIHILSKVLTNPVRPFLAIIGGAKVSSKLDVLKKLITKVDNVIVGGGMAYTFIKSKGLNTGNSLVENDLLSHAFQVVDKANYNECGFFLPEDHVIASEFSDKAKTRISGVEIPEGWMGMDIGPKTIKKFEKIIKDARTIIWNGPMGVFEMDSFSKGTMQIANAVANNEGTSVVGGGDSMAAITKAGVEDKITHISTGGGATLEFLEGKKLPGVEVLLEEQ